MHFLITGATGMIGSALISSLQTSHQVTALTRSPKRAQQQFIAAKCQVEFITTLDELDDLNPFDVVINLAGEPIANKRWTPRQKEIIEESRWHTTQQLAELFQKSTTPPHTLVNGSAVGYYGRQGNTSIDEHHHQIHDEFTHTLCKTWESIAMSVQTDRTRVCLLRTGIVLGKDQGALPKMSLPFYFGAGAVMGSGEQGMPWIHLDDMVKGIMFLVNTRECKGAYNFTAPTPVSHRVFCKTLAKTLNRPCWFKLPSSMMVLLLGEMSDLLLYGQYAVPKRLMDEGYEFEYGQLDHALSAVYKKADPQVLAGSSD